jgi:hypothetical protein
MAFRFPVDALLKHKAGLWMYRLSPLGGSISSRVMTTFFNSSTRPLLLVPSHREQADRPPEPKRPRARWPSKLVQLPSGFHSQKGNQPKAGRKIQGTPQNTGHTIGPPGPDLCRRDSCADALFSVAGCAAWMFQ